AYQFFPISSASKIRAAENQAIIISVNLPAPSNLLAFHPRTSATGFGKNRPWRWQSLLEAVSDKNELRGSIAALVIPTTGPYRGAAWAGFTPGDATFYARPEVQQIVTDLTRAFARGAFLREGGASVYTQFTDLPVTLGARAMRIKGAAHGELVVRTVVMSPAKNEPVYNKESPLTTDELSFSEQYKPR